MPLAGKGLRRKCKRAAAGPRAAGGTPPSRLSLMSWLPEGCPRPAVTSIDCAKGAGAAMASPVLNRVLSTLARLACGSCNRRQMHCVQPLRLCASRGGLAYPHMDGVACSSENSTATAVRGQEGAERPGNESVGTSGPAARPGPAVKQHAGDVVVTAYEFSGKQLGHPDRRQARRRTGQRPELAARQGKEGACSPACRCLAQLPSRASRQQCRRTNSSLRP